MTRDEHSCVLLGNSMIVFGGFAYGQRTNDIYQFTFSNNTWRKIAAAPGDIPMPRAGHSAVIKEDSSNGDCMYIFGGKDDDNNKLNDTWKFNFKTSEWIQIPSDDAPIPRSGHAAQVYQDRYMIVHGGIFFVTRELNDLHVFDMERENWCCLFKELNSPAKTTVEAQSAGLKKTATKMGSESPRKVEAQRSMTLAAGRVRQTGMNMSG